MPAVPVGFGCQNEVGPPKETGPFSGRVLEQREEPDGKGLMPAKKYSVAQIVAKLREHDQLQGQAIDNPQACFGSESQTNPLPPTAGAWSTPRCAMIESHPFADVIGDPRCPLVGRESSRYDTP